MKINMSLLAKYYDVGALLINMRNCSYDNKSEDESKSYTLTLDQYLLLLAY